MKKNIIKNLSISVLFLTFLSFFGFGVTYIVKGGMGLGIFTEPIKQFIYFPKTAIKVLKSSELKRIPGTYIKKDTSFKHINNLKYDLYGLNSSFSLKENRWEMKLFNFKNDSIIHQWNLEKENFNRSNPGRQFKNSAPKNSILLADRSLIAYLYNTNNLYKLDKNSNIIWHNKTKQFHHSMNLDSDGDIWVCSSGARGFEWNNRNPLYYRDDFVTKVSAETGKIIFDKSVSEIFIENGYKNFVYGFGNNDKSYGETDPIHINDIQPVINDTEYWKKGDLFISLRHRSVILLYRPKTNNIIRLLYGPFLNQHDVDIISDKEISIFNNNNTFIGVPSSIGFLDGLEVSEIKKDNLKTSEIIIYNFQDSTYRTHLINHFLNEKIFTNTEGFHEKLKSGDVYVESQDDGKIYIMNKEEILLKKQFSTSIDNMVERPQWIMVYENINF